jgi:rhodanese-related sulfurtransferase
VHFFRSKPNDQRKSVGILPREVKRLIDAGEDVTVVDVRQPHSYDEFPNSIPGSVRIPPAELPERYSELPTGRLLVLYCT